ncbi:transcriptional regulator, AraC family [Kribbella flavida DSM 17836]|uniref:Transcriptional regulator, AraC family n=1 Tax=Kribbella flavida (strain DSM 17836 / JCM 10339 / NBRC 14399) TaxID=479435 RepID=D2PW55_KRIFD|nr:AraC family transcriptional regulator [Kribbella flavida]ADB31507.1 transcriptional regulator, AraC family [Kribbella flavida DSM 17836]
MRLDELRALLSRHVRPDETTAIDGLHIARIDGAGSPELTMSGVVLAVLVQGAKRLAVGDRIYTYRPGSYLVTSVDVPVSGHFFEIGPDRPALGLALVLDPATIADLLVHAGPGDLPRPRAGALPGVAVADLTDGLVDALIRLVRLLERPRDRTVLAPLVKREVLWLLITGDAGGAVRQLGLADSHLSHISRAVRWIREHYAESFRVEDLARRSGMSASGFYRQFQTVTALSPIQFQKQVRLQEARLLLAAQPHDITAVAHRVGYDSPSQFSREYRRQYGVPPSRDAVSSRSVSR